MRSKMEQDAGPFTEFATMFKLDGVDSTSVRCVSCSALYPLADLLSGELEEEECPNCMISARLYYKLRPHQKPE